MYENLAKKLRCSDQNSFLKQTTKQGLSSMYIIYSIQQGSWQGYSILITQHIIKHKIIAKQQGRILRNQIRNIIGPPERNLQIVILFHSYRTYIRKYLKNIASSKQARILYFRYNITEVYCLSQRDSDFRIDLSTRISPGIQMYVSQDKHNETQI